MHFLRDKSVAMAYFFDDGHEKRILDALIE